MHKGNSPTLKCPTPAAPPPQDPSAYPCVTNVLPLRMTGLGLGGPDPKHLPLRTRPGQGLALPCSHRLGLGHCTLLRVSLPKPSPKHPLPSSHLPTVHFPNLFQQSIFPLFFSSALQTPQPKPIQIPTLPSINPNPSSPNLK